MKQDAIMEHRETPLQQKSLRYALQREPDNGCWIIVNARDSELAWASAGFWCNRSKAARLVRFVDVSVATEFAEEVFK